MQISFLLPKCAVALIAIACLSGCGKQPSTETGDGAVAEAHTHEHAHEHEGPHGGHVIELGGENYHAELTHDEATHTVAVYVLDGSAAANAPVEAAEVTINVVADNQPQQFTLPAKSLPDDPAGKTSYFEIVDKALCDGLDGGWDPHATNARLNITIDGKPYVGDVELHEHDDEYGHDEEHGPAHE